MGELLLCTEVFFQMIIFFTLLWEGHDLNSRLQRLRWLSSACPRGSREPPDSIRHLLRNLNAANVRCCRFEAPSSPKSLHQYFIFTLSRLRGADSTPGKPSPLWLRLPRDLTEAPVLLIPSALARVAHLILRAGWRPTSSRKSDEGSGGGGGGRKKTKLPPPP